MDFAELKALVAKLEAEETPDSTPVRIDHNGSYEDVESIYSYQRWEVTFIEGDSEVVHENDLEFYRKLDSFIHESYVSTHIDIRTGR